MLQKMEEERLRHEEMERRKSEQELRMREAQAQAARVPDSYATYRRPGPQQHVYDVNDDATSYFAPAPAQPSGFAEFSGMFVSCVVLCSCCEFRLNLIVLFFCSDQVHSVT